MVVDDLIIIYCCCTNYAVNLEPAAVVSKKTKIGAKRGERHIVYSSEDDEEEVNNRKRANPPATGIIYKYK